MDPKEKQPEVKEISMEELKGLLADGIKEILPQLKTEIVNELKPALQTEQHKELTKEEKSEKSAQFIKDLVNGNMSAEQSPYFLDGCPRCWSRLQSVCHLLF